MKTILHLTRLFFVFALFFCGTANGQVVVSSDYSKWVEHPLVKKFGINISNKTSFAALQNNNQALNDLDVRYLRLMTGWGQEGAGLLYEQDQVGLTGGNITYDYSRIDEIMELIKGNGRQVLFVAGYCPKALGANFNDLPDTTGGKWYNLINSFTKHWDSKNIGGVSIELWNSPDASSNFNADTADYLNLYGITTKAVKDANYKVKVGGPSTNAQWYNKLRQYTWDNNQPKDFVSGQAVGFENLAIQMYEGGYIREIKNGEWFWEVHMTSYTSFAPNSADAVSYKAASAFFSDAKYLAKLHEVTRVYMNQFVDASDGDKGIIASDGTKQPLYFALKLYNEMPFDRRPLIGENSDIQGLSSSDNNKAMLVVWNNSNTTKDVNLSLSNLAFTTGAVELIKIDETHSVNGTLSVEALGNLTSASFSNSVNIPANGVVCIRITKDEGINNMDFNKFGKYVNDKRMWWFSFSEGWCWNAFDPKTMTAYLGDTITRDWGVNQIGVFIDSLPNKFNVKWDILGNTQKMDDNTALYVRIDFEDEFEGQKYWANSVVFCDNVNLTGSFSENHGSMPSFGSGQKENMVLVKDFTSANGFDVNVADLYSESWTGEDWTGNAVIVFYIQNPGSSATGIIAKAKLTAITPTGTDFSKNSNGRELSIAYPNPFSEILNINAMTNKSYSLSIFDITGKEILKRFVNEGNNILSVPTADLAKGMYIIKIKTENGVTTNKLVKQ